MDEVPENLTHKKKFKVPTQNTPQKYAKFLLPTEETGISCCTLRKKMATL